MQDWRFASLRGCLPSTIFSLYNNTWESNDSIIRNLSIFWLLYSKIADLGLSYRYGRPLIDGASPVLTVWDVRCVIPGSSEERWKEFHKVLRSPFWYFVRPDSSQAVSGRGYAIDWFSRFPKINVLLMTKTTRACEKFKKSVLKIYSQTWSYRMKKFIQIWPYKFQV